MKHTPGPWVWSDLTQEVDADDPGCCEVVAYEPEDKNGNQAILIVLELLDEFTIEPANAYLIAAAPEMLEALCGLGLVCLADPLNPCWDNRPTDKPGLHWGSEPDAPVKACSSCIARAAIAKAQGRAAIAKAQGRIN